MSSAQVPADPFPADQPVAARPPGPTREPHLAAVASHGLGGRRHLFAQALLSWLPIAAALVVMSALVYATVQQTLRSGANDPQLQIAGDLAAQLGGGAQPGPLLGTSRVDLATSLSPYVIVFDAGGHPLASTGTLDGQVPVPPAGVLRAASTHRTELTWQPQGGVRSAIVVVPYHSATASGTVLAGRSLTEVEKRETLLVEMAGAGLAGGLVVTAAACLLAAWLRRRLPATV